MDPRDPTQLELERERRARSLLQWAVVASTRYPILEDLLRQLLAEVCRTTGWPVGHVLFLDPERALVSSGIFHLEDPTRFRAFQEVSAEARFPSGVGLPGRVMETALPHWIMDVTRDDNYPRAGMGRDLGIKAAFAFPILLRREVAAVLEFGSPEEVDPDPPFLEVMLALGTQVGWLLERRRAEEALRDSELRFRSVAETAHDAIITADEAGRIVTWNRGAEDLFGHPEAEALGRSLSMIIPTRYHASHEAGMRRVISGGERRVIGRTAELEALHRDGSEVPVELSLATWAVEGRTFFTGIVRDVSERKRSEVRLREIAAQLEASERAAVSASRAKSVFLANMSHELRTPLNAILGFTHLLARDHELTPTQREGLTIVGRAGEHLLSLINDVLSIAKIEAGEATLLQEDFDLPRLLSGLRDLFHLRAESRGLRLLFEEAPGLPPFVMGDEGKLRQVLINLLGNGVKFTTEGGVTLRAAHREGRAFFEVEDTGPGIALDEQARIFEPFVQSATGQRGQEGTGLGLSISRDFVRLMGGELSLVSSPGRGSRFFFDLPMARTAGPSRSRIRRVRGLAPGQPPRRVLAVDNAADSRRLLAQLLTAVGFEVREAQDGEEAIVEWERFRPHLVFMDMRMPVMDGYAATRAIRAREAELGLRTVIVALTASAFEHDRPAILAAGCDEIVAKPFREPTLFEVMAARLGVCYVYDDEPRASTEEARVLTADRLRAAPRERVAELQRALVEGNDQEAERALDGLAASDRTLAEEMRRLVRGFQLDELLGLLERSGT